MRDERVAGPLLALAGLSLGAWIGLSLARGRFWSVEPPVRLTASDAGALPSVAAVVPARNEAETIGLAVRSLRQQNYAGPFSITVVDDASSDATAAVARVAAEGIGGASSLEVVACRPLTEPWTGKVNALDAGVHHVLSSRGRPDYWLFTDADIVHDPANLANLIDIARSGELDLASLMVLLHCESRWERLLMPAFVFFFRKLYPFAWSNDPTRRTAAAAGGCVLIRADALDRIGGLSAIAGEIIDDCALAGAVKSSGGSTWLGLTRSTRSIRRYTTLEPIWSMVKRTAFTQLQRSYAVTALAVAGMIVAYLLPPALTVAGVVRTDAKLLLVAGLAWAAMSLLYVPTLRLYDRPAHEALALPLAATLYVAMTVDSAIAGARGRGGAWKGRTYSSSGEPSGG